jgi:twitching motility protein PilT
MQNLCIDDLLSKAIDKRASDLHITVGRPPVIRIYGELENLDGYESLDSESVKNLLYPILTQQQQELLERNRRLDLGSDRGEIGRVRINMFVQKGDMAGAFRIIPSKIPSLNELGLPSILADFAMLPSGFVLVTGPTGSGKSSTLASMIDIINSRRKCHIITIEDPVEYLHKHKNSMIAQREVGSDTLRFHDALKDALRQDPDVILVGEIRDPESMSMALTGAETGHLVLSTLHTIDTPQSIERMIDLFESGQQQQIRTQLSGVLRAVVSQQLPRRADGSGRMAALEIMIATSAIKNLIRKGETSQIYTNIQTGKQYGMQTMNQALKDMISKKLITEDTALAHSPNADELRRDLGSNINGK